MANPIEQNRNYVLGAPELDEIGPREKPRNVATIGLARLFHGSGARSSIGAKT